MADGSRLHHPPDTARTAGSRPRGHVVGASKFHYPPDGQGNPVLVHMGSKGNFAAFGHLEAGQNVRCVLIHSTNNKEIVGELLYEISPFWAAAFWDVDDDGDATLELRDKTDGRVVFHRLKHLKLGRSQQLTGITYPTSHDSPICQNFTAYGTTNVIVSGGTIGSTGSTPPASNNNGSWFLTFMNVAAGSSYTLTVNDGGAGATSSDLTVQTC